MLHLKLQSHKKNLSPDEEWEGESISRGSLPSFLESKGRRKRKHFPTCTHGFGFLPGLY